MDAGIDNVVEFDCEKSTNRFDDFEWDQLISRDAGFPLLVKFRKDAINQRSLKNDFNAFFKNEIDWVQLKGTIKKIAKSNDK